MTPKQKACELRYFISVALDLKTDDVKVLQCALIAVEEILKFTYSLKFGNALSDELEYWEEVKQEIEKL
jgi:hypothetical protein